MRTSLGHFGRAANSGAFVHFSGQVSKLNPRAAVKKPTAFKALFFFFLFLGLSFLLGGCANKAKIQNVMLPLITVKKTVISRFPFGTVREESLNGRELLSQYFNPANMEEEAGDRPERAFVKAIILGSGRPYSVDVKVFREKRVKGTAYAKPVLDKKLTDELTTKVREALADRRDDRNIIDDFRAF